MFKGRFNNIILKDDYAIIEINSATNGYIQALIDIDDVEKCQNITWHSEYSKYINNFYIRGNIQGKKISLHRLITNCPNNLVVDHIDHNSLNNRKENLRICTGFENRKNNKNNKSGYSGIQWDKNRNKWCARIKKDGKNLFIGRYDDLQKAIEARINKEKELFI